MKGKIVGIGMYKQKDSGKDRAHVYVQVPPPQGFLGVQVQHLNCSLDVFPMSPDKMLGKEFVIDCDNGFGNGFYEI